MNEQKLQVSSSPHIHSNITTRKIMLDVLIALLPAAVASVVIFGWRSALLISVCVAACMLFEFLWCRIMKKPAATGDLSAAVTGVLLAFNLPSTLPVWQALIGCLVAIVIVKQLFGGLGCNFINPALAARVVLALSFTGSMTSYSQPLVTLNSAADTVASATADAVTAATPLAQIAAGNGESLDFLTLLLGTHSGVLGETCAAALLFGGVYLVIRGVINPVIPLSFMAGVFGFTALFGGANPLLSVFSGGLVLGAVFMATDYVTSPYTNWGKLVFGLGCALITVLIRLFANSAEGVSFAILLMNLLVPYINDFTRKKVFGGGRA